MSLTFGSLFAGIGGFDLGFERAGMVCKWQVEIDDYATRVLEKHWPHVHRERDIRECGKHNLESVDVICGGFPCQDISYAGLGAGLEGERSGLFFEAIRVVRELRPRIVVLENVAALLTRGLDGVLGTLAEIGFDAEWHCIPAAAVGAPHRRDRIWIVAYPDSCMATDGGQRQIAAREGDCGRDDRRGSDSNVGQVALRGAGQGQKNVADARCFATQIQIAGKLAAIAFPQRHTWWAAEPAVGRVANGVSNRVDRMRGLGNAVVPQVAEWIGRQIVEPDSWEG